MAKNAVSSPQDADAIEKRLNAIVAYDARLTAREIKCPTLLCAADDDQLMPIWFARELVELIPDAKLMAFKGGGHMLPETRAEALNEAIVNFAI